jgi:hypothetical protein
VVGTIFRAAAGLAFGEPDTATSRPVRGPCHALVTSLERPVSPGYLDAKSLDRRARDSHMGSEI